MFYGNGTFETLQILIFISDILHLSLEQHKGRLSWSQEPSTLGLKEGGGVRASLAEQAGVPSPLLASWSQEKAARNHTAGILVTTLSGCQNWFKIAFTQRAILQICI